MIIISMDLIRHVKELKDKNGISTKAAMDLLTDTGVCRANELPEVKIMNALIRGIDKYNKSKKENAYV